MTAWWSGQPSWRTLASFDVESGGGREGGAEPGHHRASLATATMPSPPDFSAASVSTITAPTALPRLDPAASAPRASARARYHPTLSSIWESVSLRRNGGGA
jgi:hypothetical protein